MSAIDHASDRIFRAAAALPPQEQVHLATYAVSQRAMQARHPDIERDASTARIMRSTLMKPESGPVIGSVHALVEGLAREPSS